MSGIFISYRRQDAAAEAGRLYDALSSRYGGNVFLDLQTLEPGSDWVTQRSEAIKSCEAVFVVIGNLWLNATDANGQRRLDSPDDSVRADLAIALSLNKLVVPVLVRGASMPSPSELPPDIVKLTTRQSFPLRDGAWSRDVEQLLQRFDPTVARRDSSASPVPCATEPPRVRGAGFLARLSQAFDVFVGDRSEPAASSMRASPQPGRTSPVQRSEQPQALEPAAQRLEDRKHDVFISYSTDDLPIAEEIVSALEGGGRRCWIAHRDIPAGVPSWAEPIVTAISNSRLLIVLLTQHSVSSIEVLREVTLAADEKIPLLPVSLDASPLSPALRYFFVAGQRLDLARYSLGEQVPRIAPAVERQLGATRL